MNTQGAQGAGATTSWGEQWAGGGSCGLEEAHSPSRFRFCSGKSPWRASPGQTGPPGEKGGSERESRCVGTLPSLHPPWDGWPRPQRTSLGPSRGTPQDVPIHVGLPSCPYPWSTTGTLGPSEGPDRATCLFRHPQAQLCFMKHFPGWGGGATHKLCNLG